ncbi:polymorphic toxin-type HINT domain-containing protein [Parafrankia elaeagni]
MGDQVLATDPDTGRTEPHTVTHLITGTGTKHLIDITITTPNGPATLTATAGHPFWDTTDQQWTDADTLTPADQLLSPDGHQAPITGTRDYHQHDTVYNLTVDTLHTYYVLAGAMPVLVHNSNGCPNWASNSVKTWGHTFKTHGAGAKNTKALTDRARSTGNQQGQWLDNGAAAEFLKGLHAEGVGPRSVRIPDGLGQVIMPDGSIVQARAATIVPSPSGLYKTAFPIIGPN